MGPEVGMAMTRARCCETLVMDASLRQTDVYTGLRQDKIYLYLFYVCFVVTSFWIFFV